MPQRIPFPLRGRVLEICAEFVLRFCIVSVARPGEYMKSCLRKAEMCSCAETR